MTTNVLAAETRVPFAHYLITSKVHKQGDEWKHEMTKVGSKEQAGDSEEIDEAIS
jgi:hypothetical protein